MPQSDGNASPVELRAPARRGTVQADAAAGEAAELEEDVEGEEALLDDPLPDDDPFDDDPLLDDPLLDDPLPDDPLPDVTGTEELVLDGLPFRPFPARASVR